ncbi:MAG: DoxX family protein [Prevotella sp.]|nr:DoxX family protein [Prevotella sp.]
MKIKAILVNLCRFVLALTFIFSGYVKAIDPLGTQYKLHDYAEAAGLSMLAPDWLTLGGSVVLSALEFSLGIFLLFAIQRRLTSRLTLAFMIVMTLVTLWLAVANPISDCGCFGDALKLSNVQTLLKNIVLLACAIVVAWWPLLMVRFISKNTQWILINYTILFILISSLWSLYSLPQFDFRPYHIGANIPEGMEIPEGAPQPKFETTFIMEKDGQQKEFSLENYPDSTWTFIDSKSVQIEEGYVPPIHDFSIIDNQSGEDITDQILSDPGYTFLLVSPHLEQADDSNFGNIDQIYEYAIEHNYPFYCLTASTEEHIERWIELTGAEYPFCATDEITLKTIIRSNPGLVLLKNGVVVNKWSHNRLPFIDPALSSQPLEQFKFAQLPEKTGSASTYDTKTARKIGSILLWFALPLTILTLADRTWMWTKWFRVRRKKKEKRKLEAEIEKGENS